MLKKPKEVALMKKVGWKIWFCERLAPAFWMGDKKKKGARLIFICKVEGSLEANRNAFKWYLVILGMPKHTEGTLISSLLPKVEVPCRLLWKAPYTRDGWTFIPAPAEKEDTYYRMEKFCQRGATVSCHISFQWLFQACETAVWLFYFIYF